MDMNIIKLSVHNDQEAFDAAARHLKGMRQRAATPDGYNCVYETEDGKNNCVVGALLVLDTPEKKSWAKKVRNSVTNLLKGRERRNDETGPVYRIDKNGVSEYLLANLQGAHDSAHYWSADGFNEQGWERMRYIAEGYDLNTKALDALGV